MRNECPKNQSQRPLAQKKFFENKRENLQFQLI